MKKGILLVLVMALIPASAFGVAINLSGPATGDQGSSIQVEVAVNPTGATGGVNGYTYLVHSDLDPALSMSVRDMTGTPLTNVTTPDATLGLPGTPVPLNPWTGAADLGATNNGAEIITGTSDVLVATLTIDIGAAVPVGTTIVLTPGTIGPPFAPVQPPSFADTGAGGTASAGQMSFLVTPEPGSIMLLLAAVPFLIRRRA